MDLLIELHVDDLDASAAFYALLGFSQVHRTHAHAILERGAQRIALHKSERGIGAHEHFSRWGPGTPRGYGVEIVIPVEDLDAAYGRLGAHAVAAPRARAWGARDFRAQDPSGFYVCVTERYDVTGNQARRA